MNVGMLAREFLYSPAERIANMRPCRPFVLLSGTAIALILLVGASVVLLTGIGEQELPSTLTGGVAPTRKD